MEWICNLYEFFNNLDNVLKGTLSSYGIWAYLILFGVLFAETGIIFTAFLPGDSLLFAVGILARHPDSGLNIWALFIVLSLGAILGNTANYHLARYIGSKVFEKPKYQKYRQHIERTHRLFDKYGGWALILARFIPFVRTLAPFVAGMGQMSQSYFQTYNIIGGISWVGLMVFTGYFVGKSETAQNHTLLTLVVLMIATMIPIGIKYVVSRIRRWRNQKTSIKPSRSWGS